MQNTVLGIIVLVLAVGCDKLGNPIVPIHHPVQITINFGQDQDWFGGQSDYTVGTEPSYVLFEQRTLPAPFQGRGLYSTGTNHSDDLFLYIKKRIEGFAANQAYSLTIELTILTDAPAQCIGTGGAPGESVTVKAGATVVEPITIQKGDYFVMNIDKGSQANAGLDALILGNLANNSNDCTNRRFETKILRSQNAQEVATDGSGALWIIFGIDSGFEAGSSLYYLTSKIDAVPN